VNHTTHQKLARRKRCIEKRLARQQWKDQPRPMLAGRNIHYELADRDRAVTCGGIGAIACAGGIDGTLILREHVGWNIECALPSEGVAVRDLQIARGQQDGSRATGGM